MANDSDYQVEEMENSAGNKSAMAKRIAAGAGLLAAGAGTAYGAEQLMGDDGNNVVAESTQQPDLTSGAAAGTVGEGVTEQPRSQPEPQTVHTEQDVHVYHHYVDDTQPNPQPNPQPDPKPGPQPDPQPKMEYEETIHYYDDEGNLVRAMDMGTYAGKQFAIQDGDGDGHGDFLWYDVNGDGKVDENEVTNISGSNYTIGTHGGTQHYVNINTGEEIDYVPTPEHNPHGDSLADIHNDFDDEKSGEEYRDDLAQNNQDYRNHEDVHQYDEYHAGVETDEPLVAEEDGIDGNYDVESHEEDTLYAENYTLEDNNTEDYALNEEDNIESSDDSDIAYIDDDYSAEGSADDDMAYNDDIQNDDVDENVDDADQYDIV